ncbi:MAG: TetR family transcriptional regulator C-terminal domain-containing protein [Clostridium sp.]|nr:TetR family transcriptional regulator C-terminal domain-containing protein [Clostridium sp.]
MIQSRDDGILPGEEGRTGQVFPGDRVMGDEGMKQMKNDMLFYKRAYEDTSQNALWQYMLEYFVQKYTILAKEMSGQETLDTQLLFSIRLYCYGAIGMTKEWVLKDNLTSAETIVTMIFRSMPPELREIFFAVHKNGIC